MKTLLTTTLALSLATMVSAHAVPMTKGTVSTSILFNPTVLTDVSPNQGTYEADGGRTYETSASGGFAPAQKGDGTLNGTINFSETSGTTIIETLPNFFVFNDGQLGTFNFSVSSVVTLSFNNNPGISTSGSLYLLGDVVNTNLNYDQTPASLTISFNSTGGSPFSSSATLAVPPAALSVVEPGSLLMLGTGFLALGLIRRKATLRA